MVYTVRFAHLKDRPAFNIGEEIIKGQQIGVMGDTGQADGAHLHIDNVMGKYSYCFKQHDITNGYIVVNKDALIQLNYFVDNDLFQTEPEYTSFVCDPRYFVKYGKYHWGYDVIPANKKNCDIFWPRTMPGTVTFNNYTDGYGYLLMVSYEVV